MVEVGGTVAVSTTAATSDAASVGANRSSLHPRCGRHHPLIRSPFVSTSPDSTGRFFSPLWECSGLARYTIDTIHIIRKYPSTEIALQRRARHRGKDRIGWQFTLAAAAYNLIRLPKLLAVT